MFRFWPYILRSALRAKVRTTLTLLGVMVAVGIFALLASIESSMNVTIDSAAQQSLLIVNEKDQWWPTNSNLPGQLDLEKAIEGFPHVTAAMPVYIMTNSWGQSGGLVKIEGVDKEEFRQFITVEVDDEALQRFRATADGALLGADFVERYKDEYPWRIGETYKLRQLEGVSITFVGTFHSENEVYNTIILAGRRYLQEVADKLGVAHQVFVKIDDSQHAAAVIAALDAELPTRFPFKTTTRDQRSFLSASVEDLRDLIDLSYLVMLVTLAVMLVAVANTVSMATRDRLQEFGILRSLGFKRGNVIGLVVGESVAITLAGGLLGLLVVFCMLNLRPSYIGLRGINMLIHLTPGVAALALCITVLIGALGGLLPAIGVGRRKIVTALRNVE